jgi:hypothetical protein
MLSFKHKKDFLIVETYSFSEASKIGEFTFSPRVFIALGGFVGVLIVAITILIIQTTPLGYALLSHQKHPLEADFVQIAHRIQILSDSLESSNHQLEQFKSVIRDLDGVQLAYKDIPLESDESFATNSELIATFKSDFFIEDNLLLYPEEGSTNASTYFIATLSKNIVDSGLSANISQTNFSVPFRLDTKAPN